MDRCGICTFPWQGPFLQRCNLGIPTLSASVRSCVGSSATVPTVLDPRSCLPGILCRIPNLCEALSKPTAGVVQANRLEFPRENGEKHNFRQNRKTNNCLTPNRNIKHTNRKVTRGHGRGMCMLFPMRACLLELKTGVVHICAKRSWKHAGAIRPH